MDEKNEHAIRNAKSLPNVWSFAMIGAATGALLTGLAVLIELSKRFHHVPYILHIASIPSHYLLKPIGYDSYAYREGVGALLDLIILPLVVNCFLGFVMGIIVGLLLSGFSRKVKGDS